MTFCNIFLIFPGKQDLTLHANCLRRRQFAWSVKSCFLGKNENSIICLLYTELAHNMESVHPCHAESIKMPRPLLIFSQSDYLIQVVDINSHTKWQTVQIQISWLLKKPTDLDQCCCQTLLSMAYLGSAAGWKYAIWSSSAIHFGLWEMDS